MTTMCGISSLTDLEILSRPHVARNWFLEIDLPSGVSYLHSGTGRETVNGIEWRGVTDPAGGRLVSLEGIEEGRQGQASAVVITLSGANKEFFKSVHDTAAQIEGRMANLYFAVFDTETGEVALDLKRMFPGKATSPELQWEGIGTRAVVLTLESRWSAQNYPFLGKWSPAGQRLRYPGTPPDKGLDFVGVETTEKYE